MMEYEMMAEEFENHKKKKEFKNNLHLSTEYIDWLEEFTNEYECFATDSFLYEEDKLTNEEKNKVYLLEALYEVIADFADNNFINPEKTDFELFYNIEHNGIGYKIGFNYGQGASFYCLRLEEPKKDAIEYESLMSGVKLPRTVRAEEKLEDLKELIEKLIEEDVPEEAIHQATDTVLQKVKTNKRNY